MSHELIEELELEMDDTVDNTRRELAQLRTGRASPALLDAIQVEAYGTKTPVRQLANVSVPEARLIVIQPWDKSVIDDIVRAIQTSELGLTPNNDGKLIRLNVPPLTEERRRDLVKVAKKIGEEGKVRLRQIRRETNESLKKAEKSGEVPEDIAKTLLDEVQKTTDKYTEKIDSILKDKEDEIMNF
ncbi:MAG: ribosome recycling factor [Candidatus Omnitrophota bacterium]|nr:MAG: ribosome recycling factor [Candidatus Omnitrophota bacterium]